MATEQGLSLLDIGIITEDVTIDDKTIKVRGVSVRSVVSIIQRFPDLKSLVSANGMKVEDLITKAPEAVAAIIAVACGNGGNPEAEEIADALPLEVQIDILEAVGRLTFRSGFGPFVTRVVALAQAASALAGRVPDSN